MESPIAQLLEMAHEIGREDRQLAILGEGNVSVKIDEGHFAVKASGCALATLTEQDVTVCDTAQVLAMLEERAPLADELIEERLLAARVDSGAKKPSLEA